MANDEHVAMLTKGVAAWNAWRDQNPDMSPDLSQADLRRENLSAADLSDAILLGADLRRANLSAADLSEADLIEANLSGADLSEANLSEADLRGADLRRANLRAANLREADLSGADLSRAKLIRAFFTRADLSGADLSRANLRAANLSEADLDSADLSGANLSAANLSEADLSEADLSGADLSRANLSGAFLTRADLAGANLSRAELIRAFIPAANLSETDLSEADLAGAFLSGSDLREADLRGAGLEGATLVDADLTGADLTGCRVYGISAWALKLEEAKQQNLIITHKSEPEITLDNIEVAQFIYLLLHNEKIRDVIDTITSKAVLILGRFTNERKAVLDALRKELRKRNYLPILFDFSVPATRSITETISLLARMALFVVADITDARSIPQELAVIVPDLPSVPVQPLLLEGSAEYGMFEHFRRYPWLLETYRYPSSEVLIACLAERVISPAENYVRSATGAKPQRPARRTGSRARTRPARR